MTVELKRITAVKTDINSVNSGMFIRQDGFTPSFVISKTGQKLSRARILGTIVDVFVSQDGRYAFSTLDDGTGTIRLKVFGTITNVSELKKGDIVDVIGKIRMYNEETYVMPEIIYKVEDPNMIILRKAELAIQNQELAKLKSLVMESRNKTSDFEELKKFLKKKHGIEPEVVEAIILSEEIPKTTEEKVVDRANEKDRIIKLIEKLDTGSGCEYSLIIKESGLRESEIEAIINELLGDGVCFEPRPGVIKLL